MILKNIFNKYADKNQIRHVNKLIKSLGHCRTFLDSISNCTAVVDRNYKYVWLNDNFAKITGDDVTSLSNSYINRAPSLKLFPDQSPELLNQAFKGRNIRYEQPITVAGDIQVFDVKISQLRLKNTPTDYIIINCSEITEIKKTEAVLNRRNRQQADIAEFGRLALSERSLRHLQSRITERVASSLEVDHCLIIECIPDRKEAVISSSSGIDQEVLDSHNIFISEDSLISHVLRNKHPVVINNNSTCLKNKNTWPFTELQVRNIAITTIPGKTEPWGLLGISAVNEHIYSHDDVTYLQSVANILADVYERLANDTYIRESEAKFRGLLESAPDGMVIVDGDGIIEIINKQFEKLTGYGNKDIIGKPVELLIPERYTRHKYYREEYLVAPFSRRMGHDRDLYVKHKNGSEIPVEISLSPLIRKDGIYVTAAIRDITERKRAESLLQESELKYHILYDHSPDMHLSIYPVSGEIRICNQTLADTLGMAKEDIIGSRVIEYYHPDCRQRLAELEELFMRTGQLSNIHMQILTPDKAIIEVMVSASAVRDEEGNILYSSTIWRDITELKRTEEERSRLEMELFRSQKLDAIGQLTGGIAHDFNNILAGIMGYARLALRRCEGTRDEKIRDYLHQIRHGSERAKDLIEQILTYSRTIPTESRLISLQPTVEHALKLIRPTLPSSIDIQVNSLPDLPDILIDPTQLEQIIMNLCINARDAINGKGQIRINLDKVYVQGNSCESCHAPITGEYILISVSDTGCGISKEIKQRIFDPFFTSKEVGKGTGMGLSMVHGIVHECNGHIKVDTSPGIGTTFFIYFPSAIGNEYEDNKPIINEAEVSVKVSKHAKIMVVDDEEAIGNYLGELLNGVGYDVITSISSESALNLFREKPEDFDLVLTDQTMPGITGIELARGLMDSRSDIPIIMMTGYSDQVNENIVTAAGIQALLKKPIDENILLSKIDNLLNNRNHVVI